MQTGNLPVMVVAGAVGSHVTEISGPSAFQLATFTLIRGGSELHQYDTFMNSRICLRDVLAGVTAYDDIVFHEGDVPSSIQRALREKLPESRFSNVHDYGGFEDELGRTWPRLASDSYPVGYHHMCNFMSIQWFTALQRYSHAMRVDEDVCLTRLPRDAFFAALEAQYAFGLETEELHQTTLDTFNPWLREYLNVHNLIPSIPPLPTTRIFFTNFFITRIAWWQRPEVTQFLLAVNATGGIYRFRWGDAPIQTAAVRLFMAGQSAVHIDMDYVHMSTRNRIVHGEEVPFMNHGVSNKHFRRLIEEATRCNCSDSNCSDSDSTNSTNAISCRNGTESSSSPPSQPSSLPPPLPAIPSPLLPPPLPPLSPAPLGSVSVSTEVQLRALISAVPPKGALSVYLSPSLTFLLRGGPMVVDGIDLQLESSGLGATLDAQHASRVFEVKNGAKLSLTSMVIANGFTSESGAGISLTNSSLLISGGSLIANCSAGSFAGGIACSYSTLIMTSGCRVQSCSASFGGSVYCNASIVTLAGVAFINGSSAAVGGSFVLFRGTLTVTNCTVLESSSDFGGAIAMVSGGRALFTGCHFVRCTATGGGVIVAGSGSTTFLEGSVTSCHATDYAGAFALADGTLTLERMAVYNSTSASGAGAVRLTGGKMEIVTCAFNVSEAVQGGFLELLAGDITITGGTTIENTRASFGGTANLQGGQMLLTGNSSIVNSVSSSLMGCIYVAAGTHSIVNAWIINSRSATDSGCLYLSGSAYVTIIDSVILRSQVDARGGCFVQEAGTFILIRAVVEGCVSGDSNGVILFGGTVDEDSEGPLFRAISTEFRQNECQGAQFYTQGPMQFALYNVSFTPLANCDTASLASSSAFPDVVLKRCGETYVALDGQIHSVCSSSAASGCASVLVHGTVLESLVCSCNSPEFVDPAFSDPSVAAYFPSGCLRSRSLESLQVISTAMSVTLFKPELMTAELNATMIIEGNDYSRPVRWEVQNADELQDISWLVLPTSSGDVGNAREVTFPVVFRANNLSESEQLYTKTLIVSVRSDIGEATKSLPLVVSLFVQATVSFAAWGVQTVCAPSMAEVISLDVFAGVTRSMTFSTCDVDRLPVVHQLPSLQDNRRFIATVVTSRQQNQRLPIDFVGRGVYEIALLIQLHGSFHLTLQLQNTTVARLNGTAVCPANRVELDDGSCGCEAGYFKSSLGQSEDECVECPSRTSSAAGSTQCNVCAADFYLADSRQQPSSTSCQPCPRGAMCPWNATLATFTLQDDFWRLATETDDIHECARSSERSSSCLGGWPAPRCAEGHEGPLCSVCSHDSEYFNPDQHRCIACPDISIRFVILGVILAVLVVLILIAVRVVLFPARSTVDLSRYTSRLRLILRNASEKGAVTKFKILISFGQIVSGVGSRYSVAFPDFYYRWMRIFDPFSIDWSGVFVSSDCLSGGFVGTLLVLALSPLAAILLVVMMFTLLSAISGNRSTSLCSRVTAGIRMVTPLGLFAAFLLIPSVSSQVFSAWSCVGYGVRPGVRYYYLRSDLSVRCYSDEHARITTAAVAMMVLWPIGMPLLCSLLLFSSRRAILKRHPTPLLRSLTFLTRDYKKEYYGFEVFEIIRRIFLTSGILLIPESESYLRLVVALLVTVLSLFVLLARVPYASYDDQLLAASMQMILTGIFIGAGYVKAFKDTEDLAGTEVASDVYGFSSVDEIVALIIFFCLLMLIFSICTIAVAVVQDHQIATIRVRPSGHEPILALAETHTFHLFLSHVWASAQDVVAVIKRQLQKLMPKAAVFLDVDDLEDIGALEDYVDKSAVMLLYLSSGYFKSRNCMREVERTVQNKQPFILVHPPYPVWSRANVEKVKQELTSESLRAYLFAGDKEIWWHRLREFQLIALLEIAEAMLRACPGFVSHELPLPLYVPNSIQHKKIHLPQGLCFFVSRHNPGASEFAAEFKSSYAACKSTDVLPSILKDAILKRKRPSFSVVGQFVVSIATNAGSRRQSRDEQVENRETSACNTPAAHSDSAIPIVNAIHKSEHSEHASGGSSGSQSPSGIRVDISDSDLVSKSSDEVRRDRSTRSTTSRTSDTPPPPTHMLLYLSEDTFTEAAGSVLAHEVRAFRSAGYSVILVHETVVENRGCDFSTFFLTTPQDLIDAGLYGSLAVPLVHGEHYRRVSHALLAKKVSDAPRRIFSLSRSKSKMGSMSFISQPDSRRMRRTPTI